MGVFAFEMLPTEAIRLRTHIAAPSSRLARLRLRTND